MEIPTHRGITADKALLTKKEIIGIPSYYVATTSAARETASVQTIQSRADDWRLPEGGGGRQGLVALRRKGGKARSTIYVDLT